MICAPSNVKIKLLIIMIDRKLKVSLVASGSLISLLNRVLNPDGLFVDLVIVSQTTGTNITKLHIPTRSDL
jgi:hypothetical protein